MIVTRLPDALDEDIYWRAVYGLPLAAWEPALRRLAARHQLPDGPWARFALGRNVVFGCSHVVVKLIPPFWAADVPAEAAALRFVSGRLPVATATLLAEGALDGWGYLVQERLPGTLLRDVWFGMDSADQERLATQHGALMAALHTLPTAYAPAALRRDWALVIGGQWERCLGHLRESGVPAPLLADAPAYLEAMRAELRASEPAVLLHGDLNFLNLLVVREPGGWRIGALLDWSDVALGPATHELISPGVHMYRGDHALLRRWYEGYGLIDLRRTDTLQHEAMARTILWYASEIGAILERIPGGAPCRSWREVAQRLWRLGDG